MEVLDVLGNVVAIAADGIYKPGMNTILWSAKDLNGQDLSSGTYTCRMTAGSSVSTYKMVIVK
jgi:flagellar hook assembly protein FlgD